MKLYPLNKIKLNNSVSIKSINCKENIKRRLLDLGLCENTKVTPIFRGFSGDPTAFDVRGTTIAIREDDSKDILVSPDTSNY